MKSRFALSVLIATVVAATGALPSRAQADEPAEGTPAMPAAAPAAEPAPAAAVPAALPSYFSGTNDSAKPAWPDPAGGAAGVWATPAGDGKRSEEHTSELQSLRH